MLEHSHFYGLVAANMDVVLSRFLKWWAISGRKWLVGRPNVPSPEVLMSVELNRLVFTSRRTPIDWQ
jgi:hypothetical protein